MKKEIDTSNILDQLIDDFNKKMAEQFEDILTEIDAINSALRDALLE